MDGGRGGYKITSRDVLHMTPSVDPVVKESRMKY